MSNNKTASLAGCYYIGIGATVTGIMVITIMNLFTPVEFSFQQIKSLQGAGTVFFIKEVLQRFFILCLISLLSSIPFVIILNKVLKPVSAYLKLNAAKENIPEALELKAKQSAINLPFIMVPVNLVFWIIIPSLAFAAAFKIGTINALTAVIFSLRSMMAGMISSSIIFFALEAFARKKIFPLLFPEGMLADVAHTAKLSISRRIRAFYRIGGLIPLANIVLTLMILYWQVDFFPLTVKEYAWGVLIFSIVVFGLFFPGSSVLNRLVSRSISDPIKQMLAAVKDIKKGNYDTRVDVVSNDEIGMLADATNDMIRGLKEKELIRKAFGRYASFEVRDEILSGRIPMDGELKNVSVLFADIRDFTRMTETHDPKFVVKILNRYFEKMSKAIRAHNGLILQFIGDEIYAVFGAPVSYRDHHEKAVATAIEMKSQLALLNESFKAKGWPALAHGIGIHSGEVVAANIGSPDRASYLLVGDNVNLASRLQTMTKELGSEIIISSATFEHLKDDSMKRIFKKHPAPVQVRGRKRKVDIYLTA